MREFLSRTWKGLGDLYVKDLRERFTKDTIGKEMGLIETEGVIWFLCIQ